ncbi:MAG: DNA double-strand break repair nuclease NurA [Anaerolineales bacterium]
MAIDFQQIYTKIKEIGIGARERKETLEKRRAKARELLNTYSSELVMLISIVTAAKQIDPNIRCALPLNEPLASFYPLPPNSVEEATLIAADGSQIFPDRHNQVQYYVINVGAIAMQIGSGKTPEIFTDTKLHFLDEFDDTYFSESQIALQRDVAERKKLLEISEKFSGSIVALTEGQLELWGATDNENRTEFEKSLQDYLDVLDALKQNGIITSGYVDKPGANWVTRLLEIASTPKDKLDSIKKHRPLLGVTDRWLFSQFLPAEARSAVFALQAKSVETYTGSLAIHFFYLNVGDKNKPSIVRVDIPFWVANDLNVLNTLHKMLIVQAKILGHKPFPYLLHRAHEIAVVTHQEKYQIDQMLVAEIRNNNGELDEISAKKSAKDLPGRTRR